MLLEQDGSGGYTKRELPGLSGPGLDTVFNPDGGLLAAGGVHPEVMIWDTQTLREIGSLPVKGNVYDLDLIANSRSLLVASDELTLWKFLTEDELQTIENPTLAGDYLTVGMAVVMTVLIAGQNLAYPTAPSHEPDYGLCERVTEASPSGKFVVDVHSGITKEKIRVIDTASGKVIRRLNPRGGQTCGLAVNHDGTKLLIANNRVARLYDTTSWEHEAFEFK
jgi:WD40 repeat protein